MSVRRYQILGEFHLGAVKRILKEDFILYVSSATVIVKEIK